MKTRFVTSLIVALSLTVARPGKAVEQSKKFKVHIDKIEGNVTKFPFKFRWILNYMSPARHDYYNPIQNLYTLDKLSYEQFAAGTPGLDLAFYVAVSPADKNTGNYFVYNQQGEKYRADNFLFTVVTTGNGFVTNSDAFPQECITNMAEDSKADPCRFTLEDNNVVYYFSINRVSDKSTANL